MNGLQAQRLSDRGDFNWVFLVEALVTGILALFFLFYFNRLFATFVSYGIRAYTWHRYRAYIDISSLQISLLAGRIFFKSIEYHAHNITCFVYEGHITWRYWIRQVQVAEAFQDEDVGKPDKERPPGTSSGTEASSDFAGEKTNQREAAGGDEETAGVKPRKKLPCRISVKVAGVEAFIYNRSPLYDGIVEAAERKAKSSKSRGSEETTDGTSSSSKRENDTHGHSGAIGADVEKVETRSTHPSHAGPEGPQIPAFLRIFPINVECKRAAAAVGNENTTNIIVAKVEKAEGTVDAGKAGSLDLFKLLFQFDIENAIVNMKPNRDFKEYQLDAAKRILREKQQNKPEASKPISKAAKKATRSWRKLWPFSSRSKDDTGSLKGSSSGSFIGRFGQPTRDQIPGQAQWHGLTRYLTDNDASESEQWQGIEYAKVITLVECPKVTMLFYWEIPGPVPDGIADNHFILESANAEDMNGSAPPEYGMELGIHGGFVQYGPWADRQRINLQQLFFPAVYFDAEPSQQLEAGKPRVSTVFKINVVVEENVVLRIPCRESSKDPRWKGRAENAVPKPAHGMSEKSKGKSKNRRHKNRKDQKAPVAVDARPYGWLDIKVMKDSVVKFSQDMYPRSNGYRNALDIDVKGIEMESSVNHGLLWRSGALTLEADLSYPLSWNSLRKWPFKITCDDVELFILRDHMFLIIDLVNDWASGPTPDFYTFVPFRYVLDMTFRNFCMYLNVNDSNIINDPANFERNDFLTLEGQLQALLDIPMEAYVPQRSQITFDVLAESMKMRMLSPQRSTHNPFMKNKTVAELPKLTLSGSHSASTDISPGVTDILRFNIAANGLCLYAYGFLVRQLVSLKENYFGDYLHFKTLEEFQSASEDLAEANRLTASFPKPKTINELDVILCIVVEDSTVLFPTNLYSAQEFVRAEVSHADLDLRVASYYLDMGLNLAPVRILSGTVTDDDTSTLETDSAAQIYVSHLDLYGHRMFGLPPDEPAYVSEWDIGVGKIKGELSSSFVNDLARAGQALAFTINDGDNALPLVTPSIMLDCTFVQVQTDTVRLGVLLGSDALLLCTEPIRVESNDWASEMFSQRVSVLASKVTFACVDASSVRRQAFGKQQKQFVRTLAFLQTGVALNIVKRKQHFTQETQKQQAHIELSSQRTGRGTFLRRTHIHAPIREEDDIDFEPPAMCSPPLPAPVTSQSRNNHRAYSIKSVSSALSGRNLSHKSSSSSLSASLRTLGLLASTDTRKSTEQESHHKSAAPANSLRGNNELPSLNLSDVQEIERRTISLMAFSSPFSEPHFSLDMIEPDETNLPAYPIYPTLYSTASGASSISETIELSPDDRDLEHMTVLINIVPGIRAFVDPKFGLTMAGLASQLLPKNPDDVLDAFQVDVMGTIKSNLENRHGHESVVEIQASLPAAHIRVGVSSDQEIVIDQADLKLRALESVTRIRQKPSRSGGSKTLALHNTLAEMNVSLKHRTTEHAEEPSVSVIIDDVLLWMALADANSFHLSFRETSVFASGSQTKDVCALILRLLPIVKELQDEFGTMQKTHLRRLQLLTYILTLNGQRVGDPPFTTRMVSTILAFPDHFRNQDSWKILMRFRYILANLPSDVLNQLKEKCKSPQLECPDEAPEKTLERWTQWYNWDIPYVNQTLAFRRIFNATADEMIETDEPKPSAVTFRSELLRLVIRDKKEAAEISFEETSLGLENTPPVIPEGLMINEEHTRTHTTAQMHTNKISIALDWGLVDIAEHVLSIKDELEQLSASLKPEISQEVPEVVDEGLARHTFTLVLSTDTGKLSLQTLNLRYIARSEGLKMSLIGTSRATDDLGQCVSGLLTCDTAVTELRGPSQRIWQTLLTSPNLYLDYLSPAPGIEKAPTATVAIGYKDLQLAVVEQIPGILHIVDSIIVDEVGRVQQLISTYITPDSTQVLPTSSEIEQALAVNDTKDSPSPKVNVALLAGQIHLSVSLLQELSYQLEGKAASVRVAPDLARDGKFTIDFDVGRQDHAFINTSRNERHTQGILQLPPINGNVGLELSDSHTSVSVASTIEKIEVDATAIQGVIGVINRPEVQDIISAIKSGIEDVKERVDDVVPKKEKPQPKVESKSKQLVLDVRFALLGVRVSASTAHTLAGSIVEVEFGIGPLHATATNKKSITEVNPHFPEIRAKIQDIGARLYVKDRKGLHPCGHVVTGIFLHFNTTVDEGNNVTRELRVRSDELEVQAHPETASLLVDVVNHLQDKIKHLDLSKEFDYLRHIRDQRKNKVMTRIRHQQCSAGNEEPSFSPEDLLAIKTTIEFSDIHVSWLVDPSFAHKADSRVEDLVFSISRVEFTTRGGHEARLTIMDLQLQLVKRGDSRQLRSLNSALMPEVTFSVGIQTRAKNRSFAVRATGKTLDIGLESGFMRPVSALQKSIEHAISTFQRGTETWQNTPTTSGAPRAQIVDIKHMESLLVEADFAGAVVHIQGSKPQQNKASLNSGLPQVPGSQHGRYGQFAEEGSRMQTKLTSPGISLKIEYNSGKNQPSINAEFRIDASSNKLLPNVVPLVLEITNTVKEVMQAGDGESRPVKKVEAVNNVNAVQKFFEEDSIITASPAKLFGKTKVNIGIRVCKQEFAMTCQPIARVDASASIEDFYFTMNTIDSDDYGHFFALSAVMTNMSAQVKHMYSREPTFSYNMESIVLSAMNTKHLSGIAGINAVLDINPTRFSINARQFQDLMLFREIWLPPEIRNAAAAMSAAEETSSEKPEEYLVQRYQTVAAAAAFPWNATVFIAKLTVDLDLGQSIGKSTFEINNLWASQQKSSNLEQHLCIGMDGMGIHSTGRMSGDVSLGKLGVRLTIKWPEHSKEIIVRKKTPLIQASISFQRLRAKISYDYQAFAFGDIEGFDFLMYNVRESGSSQDRLVALLDFAKAYVFCTSTSPAQAVGLYQAFDRLIQDKQNAYAQSLKDIEKHMRRESTVVPTKFGPEIVGSPVKQKRKETTLSISLHTDVVVSLGALCFGVYPTTFFDSQMLKLEANTIQARFAVGVERRQITSVLSLTLGQLQVALASTRRVTAKPKPGDVTVDDVIANALNSKGGTILRVPKVIASMQTWQMPDANKVEYIFKSLFDGKIDVGWNLSRIDFIKGMWTAHARALASRIGKSLPESAVKIIASSSKKDDSDANAGPQEKITAEINLPQSRYEYLALEPPIIETPQLRDMGEATPPLEWIGLHRDRLPNVTHQIIIVSLLEICKEVEDAYGRILGSS